MTKMTLLFSVFVTLASLISCSDNSESKEKAHSQNNASNINDVKQVDTTYMYTGFYFLADEGINGVKMKVESSNEFYSLAKEPFASVTNIKQSELKTTKLEQGDYTELCLTFDSKGTKDLEEGTGNTSHPKIAVVIAGKLLYVVDNTTKIKTGIMCIGLVGYTTEDMTRIKIAVDQKN